MPDVPPPIDVAILVVPEFTAPAVRAMHNLLAGAGRDWAYITSGVPGPVRMRPYVVTVAPAGARSANGISITPDYTLDNCRKPSIVCVPDFSRPLGASCAEAYPIEAAWRRCRYDNGPAVGSVCTGTILLAAADLRSIQELPGQAGLPATQRYAAVDEVLLLDVWRRTHPRG